MRPTTQRRYKRIREEAAKLYGTMPVMKIYIQLADQFDLSDEHIRRILRKKHPPNTTDGIKCSVLNRDWA